MFIGRIGTSGLNQFSLLKQAVNRMQAQETNTRWKKNFDVTSFFISGENTEDIGIYHKSNYLKPLVPEHITYDEKKDTSDLSRELLPPAEREYTERDALMNQYGKQFRLDDGFMAAQLRESMSQSEQSDREYSGSSTYSYEDLQFAGQLAKTLNEELTYWNGRTYMHTDGNAAWAEKLAAQYHEIQSTLSKSGISDRMKSVFQESFHSVEKRLMEL